MDVGFASEQGPRDRLEDFADVVRPAPHEEAWGVLAAVADGVSTGGLGLEAAQSSVLGLLSDYYATPATWDTSVALDRLIGAQNDWLLDHNRRRQGLSGQQGAAAMTTLTALVLRGHGYTVAHVGDSRAYLIRGGECVQLTTDHTLGQGEFQNGLTRALGLDVGVRIDYVDGDLQIGDVFVLTSDGVHGYLKRKQLLALASQDDAARASRDLVSAALASGGRDNATALVIRIKGLASAQLEDAERRGRQLPVPSRLQAGDLIDGYRVRDAVFSNGVHRLYRVEDERTGGLFALKTLHESRASDPEERSMLAHEAWLGARVTERDAVGLVKVVEPAAPSAFYALFEWHAGRSLADLLAAEERFDVPYIVAAMQVITRAVGRLHQHGVIHRDIKPDNLHLGDDGHWRLLDLGVALSGKEPAALRELHAGTPSYMNPEQWSDDPVKAKVSSQSDLFALGVTLYQWLTGRLPYGEVEPYQTGRYRRDPIAPSRLRPDVPIWLDNIVLKAVARDPVQRFETAEEMLLALDRGASRPLLAPLASPLLARDPAAVWKIGLGLSVLVNVLLVYWLLFLPKV